MTRSCYIFDIDGTLADCSHRLHHIQKQPKDWDAFFAACMDDQPIAHMVALAKSLPLPIVCVSGRSDVVRVETDFWLRVRAGLNPAALYMRRAGDRLVLINAIRPGTGALTLCLALIAKHGLKPAVIAPTPELADALLRRGWERRKGSAEIVWTPATGRKVAR